MRELSPQGMSEDGRFLIARDDQSDELFALRAGHRLVSLIDASGLRQRTGRDDGQLEITMESSLNPREIQTRIRRGESPDQVAESAGVPVAQIIGFATPVLAEREYVCEQARKTAVRGPHGAGQGPLLGDAVASRMAQTGGLVDQIAWDSWRREDGRWTVVATPAGEAVAATFIFDLRGRYVLASDAAAQQLVGDAQKPSHDMAIADAIRSPKEEAPAVATSVVDAAQIDAELADSTSGAVRSLKEVRDRKALEQLALGIDAEPPVAAEPPAVPAAEHVDHPSTKRPHERRRVPTWDEIMFGGGS